MITTAPSLALSQPSAPTPSRWSVTPDECRIELDIPFLSDPTRDDDAERINQAVADRFQAARANFTPMLGRATSLTGGGQVAYDDGHLTAVTLAFDQYAGGAHPNPWLETVLYDGDQHREVKLPDLFTERDKALPTLAARVADGLKNQPDVDESFISQCVSGSAENLSAFQPTADGLQFALPAYRSGPYGAGMFDSAVPYADLRGILDPRGPLWRQSAPFTFDGPDGPARKQSFERLVAAHRVPGTPAAFDPKDDPVAPLAARAFLTVRDAAEKGDATLDTLTTQYVVLREALGQVRQEGEAEKSFTFLDDKLRAGVFGSETRDEVTTRFVSALLSTGSAEEARRAVMLPTTKPAGTVEKGADSVVIGGIRVPIKE